MQSPAQARILHKSQVHGFTLFEVAISLLIVSFGVISVLALFPLGLKHLEKQRFRAYAATIANQLIDDYGSTDPSETNAAVEAPAPWETSFDRRIFAPDLETRLCNIRDGIAPIPTYISRRIDSDGDEIKNILDEGGQVYYLLPSLPVAFHPEALPQAKSPNNLQKIIIGVSGYAQHNASFVFPMKRWPYYYPLPSPPMQAFRTLAGKDTSVINYTTGQISTSSIQLDYVETLAIDGPNNGAYSRVVDRSGSPYNSSTGSSNYCWASLSDNGVTSLTDTYKGFVDYMFANLNNQSDPATMTTAMKALNRYIVNASKYLRNDAAIGGPDIDKLFAVYPTNSSLITLRTILLANLTDISTSRASIENAARKVLAINYLTHALKCITRWYDYSALFTGVNESTNTLMTATTEKPLTGALDSLLLQGSSLNKITIDNLRNLDANCRYLYLYFTSACPYNWAVPRPMEQGTMMDFPLLELDIFSKPMTGIIAGSTSRTAAQWRYMSPQSITNLPGTLPIHPLGPSLDYPRQPNNGSFGPSGWTPTPTCTSPWFSEQGYNGSDSHYSLLKPFLPSERCRQLIFWMADWQNYEDFETAPSAELDCARYPRRSPASFKSNNLPPTPITTFAQFMDFNPNLTSVHALVNPELWFMFLQDMTNRPTGGNLQRNTSATSTNDLASRNQFGSSNFIIGAPNTTTTPKFGGAYGADRNGNGILDRGNLKKSVRIKAITLDSYNFYDMRAHGQIR